MMNKEMFQLAVTLTALTVLLLLSAVQSLSFGVVEISFQDIARMLYYQSFGINTPAALQLLESVQYDVIFDLRLPRIIMAIICGSGLALGGVVMQAVIRNPLADPYILGVSSGAALGATASIILGSFSMFGIYGVSIGAFLGAVAVTFTVFSITFSAAGSRNTTKLILAGTALNAICSACTSMIVYMAKDIEGIRNATFWIMGSMARTSWDGIPLTFVLLVLCCLYFIYQYRILNASLLGDEMAVILGIQLENKRKLYLLFVAILISSIVAMAGIIGFVGLVIPHIVRIIYGNNHIKLLPVAIVSGAIYMVWCDIFARTVLANTEMPIGILTSLIGGPFFLYLMLSKKYGYGDS